METMVNINLSQSLRLMATQVMERLHKQSENYFGIQRTVADRMRERAAMYWAMADAIDVAKGVTPLPWPESWDY
jgi:hypothetical protein